MSFIQESQLSLSWGDLWVLYRDLGRDWGIWRLLGPIIATWGKGRGSGEWRGKSMWWAQCGVRAGAPSRRGNTSPKGSGSVSKTSILISISTKNRSSSFSLPSWGDKEIKIILENLKQGDIRLSLDQESHHLGQPGEYFSWWAWQLIQRVKVGEVRLGSSRSVKPP